MVGRASKIKLYLLYKETIAKEKQNLKEVRLYIFYLHFITLS